MSEGADMLREIELHEAWLRRVMPAEAPLSTAALKLRLRVAVQESWLADAVEGASPLLKRPDGDRGTLHGGGPNLDAVKHEVRAEIERLRGGRPLLKSSGTRGRGTQRIRGRLTLCGAGLAAAAALVLVFLSREVGPKAESPVPIAAADTLQEFARVLSEVVPAAGESESEWDEVRDGLGDLEEALADAAVTSWDDEFEEMDEALDSLLEQIGTDS